jgi:hypothetical protein
MKFITVACATTLLISGCASAVEDFNKNLSAIHAGRQKGIKHNRGNQVLPITPEQQNQIAQELSRKVPDARMQALITDASPAIKEFIGKVSCLPPNTSDGTKYKNLFAIFAVPGRDLFILSPLNNTPYHNKSACLTVKKIQGWTAPALNALQFEVVYTAEDSGESAKKQHQTIKQPDGTWLFSQ